MQDIAKPTTLTTPFRESKKEPWFPCTSRFWPTRAPMFTCQNCKKKIWWLFITPSVQFILLYITMEFYNFSSKSSSAEFFAVFPTVHDVAALLTRHTHELSKNNDETRQFSVFSILCLSLCAKCKNTAINANLGIISRDGPLLCSIWSFKCSIQIMQFL